MLLTLNLALGWLTLTPAMEEQSALPNGTTVMLVVTWILVSILTFGVSMIMAKKGHYVVAALGFISCAVIIIDIFKSS